MIQMMKNVKKLWLLFAIVSVFCWQSCGSSDDSSEDNSGDSGSSPDVTTDDLRKSGNTNIVKFIEYIEPYFGPRQDEAYRYTYEYIYDGKDRLVQIKHMDEHTYRDGSARVLYMTYTLEYLNGNKVQYTEWKSSGYEKSDFYNLNSDGYIQNGCEYQNGYLIKRTQGSQYTVYSYSYSGDMLSFTRYENGKVVDSHDYNYNVYQDNDMNIDLNSYSGILSSAGLLGKKSTHLRYNNVERDSKGRPIKFIFDKRYGYENGVYVGRAIETNIYYK